MVKETCRFLLELDEAKGAVVEHDDFYRQTQLHQAEEIAHQHGKPAVARQRDDLPTGERRLRADRLRHRIGHGAVPERSEKPPLAIHCEIAGGPHRRQTNVAGEDGVLGG